MKMISYAQNGEDVMLSRALRGVERGFYIDAGAAGPTEHSVTRTFYDRGWRGINVEPTQRFFDALAAARPRDVNIQAALDEAPGVRTFYAFEGTGLSTLEADVAEGHKPGGWPMTPTTVQTRTLAELCAEHAPEAIHFLKIDVEGAEERVLRGADFTRFRPWIVVVEATRPMSPEPDYAAWEPILLEAGYEFAWFDGLNRFYLARERADGLRGYFRVPVNYFDDFDLYNPIAERERARADGAEAEAERARQAAEEAGRAARAFADAEAERARSAIEEARVEREAALAAASGARRRVGELGAEAGELRRGLAGAEERERSARAALDAQGAEHAARAAQLEALVERRRRAQEEAEARAAGLGGQVAELGARLDVFLRPPGPPEDGKGRPRGFLRWLAVALYRVTLRPLVRPVLMRSRAFLVSAVRHDQLVLAGQQRAATAQLAAQITELRSHLDNTAGWLRAVLDHPVAVATPPAAAAADPGLAELARSMESALLALTVTAVRAGSEPGGATP